MTKITIKSSAVASGDGSLTAGDLLDFANQIPRDAVVKVTTHSSQREGESWHISCEWEGVKVPNPGLNYPPGVRGEAR